MVVLIRLALGCRRKYSYFASIGKKNINFDTEKFEASLSLVRVGILMFTAELLILWVKSAMSEYCYALIKCRLL
jgi:hypothetical protein